MTTTRHRRALRILISAGPTREPLDSVRFISNYSTGYLGGQLATEALARGHRVVVVSGPTSEAMPPGVRVIHVERTKEMQRAMRQEAPRADAIIMAAAVADFQPARRLTTKTPRRARWHLELKPTPDIVKGLSRRRGQIVAAFALEHEDVLARAKRKLRDKHLDLLIAQAMNGHGEPFGRRPIHAWLLTRDGTVTPMGVVSKSAVAGALLDKIESLWYGQP